MRTKVTRDHPYSAEEHASRSQSQKEECKASEKIQWVVID